MKVQNRKLLLRNNSVAILPKCRDTMGLLKKDRRIRLKDFAYDFSDIRILLQLNLSMDIMRVYREVFGRI